MKKNVARIIIILTLFVLLSFMLFSNIVKFNYENVETVSISVDGNEIKIDKSSESVRNLISRLISLKQYKTIVDIPEQDVYKLTLAMKHTDDKTFNMYLDYDFTKIYITDMDNGLSYVIDDDLVEQIYMFDILESFYKYSETENHTVSFQGDEISTRTKSRWSHVKGDNNWYKEVDENNEEISKITIDKAIDEFEVVYSKESNNTELIVYLDDAEVFKSDLDDGFYIPEKNGLYKYTVRSTWSDKLYSGSYETEFLVECAYPPKFTVSKKQLELGEFTSITASNIFNPELLYVNQDVADGVEFIKNGEFYECIIPATYYTGIGDYEIEYGLEGYFEDAFKLEIVNREFSIQYLQISKTTEASTRTNDAYAQYNKYYKSALAENKYNSSEDLSSLNKFILPVNGRLSTEFGERRYVNGEPTSYHHAGFDIASPSGTIVKSTYHGEVVLAMELILTGNSIVIDHGNGIYSTYFHLNEMFVDKGDIVSTGQEIGAVGTTGFSTGPHLHFSISYHKMNLEPGYFIYGKKVTYENYKELFNK